MNFSLPDLGWTTFFQTQLSDDEAETCIPLRVTEVHRNAAYTLGKTGAGRLSVRGELADHGIAVGDWVLTDVETGDAVRVLDRKSLLKRRAAREGVKAQLIAANVDTLFIVSSCNADFNEARLERYLAMALQAEVEPVVILTKSDMCDNPSEYLARGEKLMPDLQVLTLDATAPDAAVHLKKWCAEGQTVALLGSSGVGKSTLSNTLTGLEILTQEIREDDAKGRHTTTTRSMHATTAGGWLIDTPGMRSLPLLDVAEGVERVFADIVALAEQCKFRNCAHAGEPKCAVQGAIKNGTLDANRLARWQKLAAEDQENSEVIADAGARKSGRGKRR